MKTLKVIVENPPKDCGECEFFICQPVENQKLRYRVAELEGEESSGARWKILL